MMHAEVSLSLRLPQHLQSAAHFERLENDKEAARLTIRRALDRLARRQGIVADHRDLEDQVEDLLDYVVQPDFEVESDG